MVNQKSLDNLKNGKRFKPDDNATKNAARNAAKAKSKNVAMRKLAQQLLNAKPEVGDGTIRQLKQLGFNTESPDLQTLILARIGSMAIGKDSRLALQATQMLLEISGNDVRSLIAADEREIQTAHLELERERFEFEKEKITHDPGTKEREHTVASIIEAVKNVE